MRRGGNKATAVPPGSEPEFAVFVSVSACYGRPGKTSLAGRTGDPTRFSWARPQSLRGTDARGYHLRGPGAKRLPRVQSAVMAALDHKSNDAKWQTRWAEADVFRASDADRSRKKAYILDMFPYPSGAGLHVGHPEGYTAT